MICVYEIITAVFDTYELIMGPYKDRESALEEVEKMINGNGRYSTKNTCEHLGWKVTYKIVDITITSEEEVYALT